MNKKLLIGLSSMALVAGFWACGEGSVEVIEEQSDDEMIRALLATDNMKFGASDIKKAKDACMNDFECFNEMTKAQGAAIVESSSEEALSSATPVSSTVASSSSDGGFKFSSIGPIGDLSSSSEVAPPPQSSSSEEKPLTGLGDCGPSSETVELMDFRRRNAGNIHRSPFRDLRSSDLLQVRKEDRHRQGVPRLHWFRDDSM